MHFQYKMGEQKGSLLGDSYESTGGNSDKWEEEREFIFCVC